MIKNVSFTPDSGINVNSISASHTSNIVTFSASLMVATGNNNTWKTLGTITEASNVDVFTTAVNSDDGSYVGMLVINNAGIVAIYLKQNITNKNIGFSISYKTLK